MEKNEYMIWLSQMKSITYEDLKKLLNTYKSLNKIWDITPSELEKNIWLTKQKYKDLLNIEYKRKIQKIANYMENNNIKIISYDDIQYPQKLRYIENRPKCIYVKGNIDCINNESVAIVGSRNVSIYGKKSTKYFSMELAKRHVNIISGLARGVDSIAHTSALVNNSKTYAVMGNGLDIIYPKENIKLAEKILCSGGAIISEYVIGTKPECDNFPRRNRIISGLSDAVIVIEATKKSGALITADYAINQGKDVWAVPGNINSYNSLGTNQLIKDGANILTCIDDIIR